MAENTLNTVFGYDEHNLGESRKIFRDYGLLDLFERVPGLFEALQREVAGHLASMPDGLARRNANAELEPAWDAVLRSHLHLSTAQQFLMAIGHLFRGHVSEVYEHVRRAVEAAGIAYLSKAEPDLGDLWLANDRRTMASRTTSAKLFPDTDPLTAPLRDTYDHASGHSHNNFMSFAARVKSEAFVEDGRLHFKTRFAYYEMEDDGYVLRTAIWVLRQVERTALLLAKSFDLPDCVWYRRLDLFRRDLNEACQRLRPLVQPGSPPPPEVRR